MELTNEQKQALDCLYGKKTLPVCAVGSNAQLLWQNLCYEQRYLLLLLGQMPQDDGFHPPAEMHLRESGGFIRCTAERMGDDPRSFYLLQFQPAAAYTDRSAAFTETLQAFAAGNRLAAGDALYALGDLHRSIVSSNCGEPAFLAADRLLAACYRLLHQALHCEELAWYAEEKENEPAPVTDLAEQGSRLSLAIQRIAGDLLPHHYSESHVPLWVRAHEDRLFFALLAMYLLIHRYNGENTPVHIRCEENGTFGVISMETEPQDELRHTGAHVPVPSPADSTELSDEALLRRFCSRYHGTLLQHKTEKGSTLSLRLPLTEPDTLTFESPHRTVDEGRYSPEQIMLSALVDYRHMGRF